MVTALIALFGLAQATAPGATVMLWHLDSKFDGIPKLVEGQVANQYFVSPGLTLKAIKGAPMYGEVTATLRVDRAATYDFEVTTNAMVRMTVSGETMLNSTDPTFQKSKGVFTGQYRLPVGRTSVKLWIMHNDGDLNLSVRWKPSTARSYSTFADGILTTEAGQTFVVSPGLKRATLGKPTTRPGDQRPLESVHPSFQIEEFRGDDFRPAVGGMAFLPDGRLAVCTWDELGAVYLLEGLDKGPARAKLFASGLGEPLGIAYWNGDLYVTQKGEVTRLRDNDKDGQADEYIAVAHGWGVSPNYHEFTFNLVPFQGKMFISSSIPLRGGHTNYTPELNGKNAAYSTPSGPGCVFEIDPLTGAFTSIANGLRTPNGMNIGVDGKLFVADNQGSWLPSSTLFCIEKGSKFLHPEQPDGKSDTSCVSVWFPHGEIGNSPSQMVLVPDGPYRGQMLIGDVTHGGIKRLQLEKVGGKYQGVVFRHSQGIEAGVNRMVWGPDGCLYVGGIGSNGNWNHKGHKFGLERLRPTGGVPFEMLEVGARKGGFQVRFTKPVGVGGEAILAKAKVKSWRYVPTIDYGGPKVDEKTLKLTSVDLSQDRQTAFLRVEGLQEGTVTYFNLGDLKDSTGNYLWSPEAWYTLQRIPSVESIPARSAGFEVPIRGADILIGKQGKGLLQPKDGKSRWKVVGDALEVVHNPAASIGGSDHVSTKTYGDCFMHLEWFSPPGGDLATQTNGNSGVKLQGFYEVQIMNAPGIADLLAPEAKFNEAGSIYRQTAPTWNPSYGAGVWQSYDIWFTAAKFQDGKKVANARMTVAWNGVIVHDNVEVKDKTGLSDPESPGEHRHVLQDHQNLAEGGVRFRNVWVSREHPPIPR